MKAQNRLTSLPVVVLGSILLPPLGLVLLWMRGETGTFRKLLGTLAIAVLAVGHLVLFFGLRMEMDGSGLRPIFKFYKPEDHYAALERSRASQGHAAQPVSAPAGAAPEAPAASTPASPAVGTEPAGAGSPSPAPTGAGAATPSAPPSIPAVRAYWTDFRGPRRDGRYDQAPIATDWANNPPPVLWKQPAGGGYASFAIAGGRAFTIEQRRNQEVVSAYDMETGREIWTHGWNASFQESMGGDGPRATPTWHDGRVYALGAEGELRCLDAASGRRIWGKNILADNDASNLQWGMSGSPLVVDDKVIVLPGGTSGKSVVAYNRLTGEPVWKVLNDQQAYTAPMLVTMGGRRQLLVVSASRVMGLTVEEGKLLWEHPWVTDHGINSAQPLVVSDNRLFISAGYGHGSAMLELSPAGEGFKPRVVWENLQMKNKFASSVLYQGHIYGLDENIMACIDVETGERKWKGGRYGYGQLVLAGGHVVVLTEYGEVVLVKATPEGHQEVGRVQAIDGKTWNHPAIDSGRLLVRNTTEMACLRIGR